MTRSRAEPGPEDLAGLVQKVAKGDRAAFARLYRHTAPRLFSVILRIVREESAAEEALQDVYIRLWQKAASYDPRKARVTTWLNTIARNRALDEVRGRRGEMVSGLELTLFEDEVSPGPAQDAHRAGMARELSLCLEELEGDQRRSVLMAFYEGMTHSELAAAMKKPLGTIKSWVRRALMELKECLDRGGHRETV